MIKTLRYLTEYGLFRLVGLIFRALPIAAASGLSGFFWRHLAPFFPRHKRALANLARAYPEKPEAERETIARAMWDNLGRTFAESFHIDALREGSRVTFEDEALYDALRARPGGAVFCGAHAGNWEITVLSAHHVGKPCAAIYQRIKNPYVDRYVTAGRAPLYTAGILAKSREAAGFVKRVVREGGGVAFLVDQRDQSGVCVPFFGSLAPSTTFPALLARALKVPVYVARVVREDGARFKLGFCEVAQPRSADRDADILAGTAAIQAAIEDNIRAHPEQWMWAHRRWG